MPSAAGDFYRNDSKNKSFSTFHPKTFKNNILLGWFILKNHTFAANIQNKLNGIKRINALKWLLGEV